MDKRTDLLALFFSVKLHAWLYLPMTSSPPPVVIMAHGFGLEKVLGLHKYASAFSNSGLASLVFDYRGFGKSENDCDIDQLIDPKKHVEDYLSVINYVIETSADGAVILWVPIGLLILA